MLSMIRSTISYGYRNIENGLRKEISGKMREIFEGVAVPHGFEIQKMRVVVDHVHIFLRFLRGDSIAPVVGILKSVFESEAVEKYPGVKKELWEELGGYGYFVRTGG